MEHSQPSPVHPSTTKDALQLLGDMYEEMDPVSPSLPTLESSQPFAEDSMGSSSRSLSSESMKRRQTDPVEQMEPSKRFKPSELINQGQHGSTHSSPPIMEPSQRSSVDSMSFPPPVETSQRLSADSMGFSPSLEPTQRSPVDSVLPSSPNDASQTIREMYQEIDPAEQIDPLIRFLENRLHKMNNPSEAGSSSSEGWVETVRDSTELAAKTVDMISIEAGRHSTTDDAVEAAASIMLKVLEGIEERYWVWIGLSVAAFTVESLMTVGCTDSKCTKLFLKIIELVKDVKQYTQQTRHEKEKVRNGVVTIVEGAVICCDRFKRENRFWSPETAAAQLEKTNQLLGKDYGEVKHVFLSHSGKQKNFVRQLHKDLTREHVECFFDEDDDSLPLGHKFPPLIFKAAETCKIAVVVLSKEFIQSKWPMLELSGFIKAMKSGKNAKLILIPIFYKIKPGEISQITKDSPLWKNLKESDVTEWQHWQDALKYVRPVKGLELAKGGDQVDCREKVVKKICLLLRGVNPPKLLDFQPVGIEDQVLAVEKLLELQGTQPVLAVIVYGFGGAGKSTIAASVVESLDWSSMDFKFCRVIFDETTPKTSHIVDLQKHIINNLGGGTLNLNIQNPPEGRDEISKALQKKFSLLFIDNVVHDDDIRDLLPKDMQSWEQNTKLRIIITSRDKNVQGLHSNIVCKEYEVEGLSDLDSKKLLMNTIVQGQRAEGDEISIINEVAVACRGVPLLLSVLGEQLTKNRGNKASFRKALDALKEGDLDFFDPKRLTSVLMFVYNQIDNEEVKEGFLDICTYFHGWEWNVVADIVDSGILDNLQERRLVSNSSDKVIVHDILRLIGVKKAEKTRLSDYENLLVATEDYLDGKGDSDVKGLSLVNSNSLITITTTQLEAMRKSLRVLILGDWVRWCGPPCDRAFRELRYLSVGDINAFPLAFKDPSNLRLRVFFNKSKPGMNLSCLPSSLKRISHQVPQMECDEFAKLPFQNLSCLKSFIVETTKSVALPEKLHLPASLVCLDLSRCTNVTKTSGHLTALESLTLSRSDLNILPQGFGELKKLKHLRMDYCLKLGFLSEELRKLSSLESLGMIGCRKLRALPKSLGGLISLQKLELEGCINLKLLPESFGELCISSLDLVSLENLQELPSSFGKMPLLKFLKLESCHSLESLPDSFVQLKMLERLIISKCRKFSILPADFGRLKCLNYMTVESCQRLMELPHGFGALPALKTFRLAYCSSFVNISRDFPELASLEELHLENLPLEELPFRFGGLPALKTFRLKLCRSFVNLPRNFRGLASLEELHLKLLPLISRFPDGFGKVERLRFLSLQYCGLETLSEDFEEMATLERLVINDCSELEGAMMEKILKLQNCIMADISGSEKLVEKWKQMQREIECPIAVYSGDVQTDREEAKRLIRVVWLNGKCVEMGCNGQLVERSSALVGLEHGTQATLAFIILPTNKWSLPSDEKLQQFVQIARQRAETNGSAMLQIVCARQYSWDDKTPSREYSWEEDEILQLLPEGSCALSKRLTLPRGYVRYDVSKFVIVQCVVDMEGPKSFDNFKFMDEWDPLLRKPSTSEIPEREPSPSEIPERENKKCKSIQDFFHFIRYGEYASPSEDADSICNEESESASEDAVQSKREEFIETLKGNGIDHLLVQGQKLMVNDLHGKTIGLIICNVKIFEWGKLQQIFEDVRQKDSNFLAIWIDSSEDICGHGTHTRATECWPWATFPHPMDPIDIGSPSFVLLDKGGHIIQNEVLAWHLLVGWGGKLYPFTQQTIRKSFFSIGSESWLEFLLHGMNIVGRKPMKSRMTFLYAGNPSESQKMRELTHKLEELSQIQGNFEVLYVGDRSYSEPHKWKQDYEDGMQDMRWPSLSLSDAIMFWHRCKFLASEGGYELYKQSNLMMETLHRLAKDLQNYGTQLVLVDKGGVVTSYGEEVVEMICDESWDGEGNGMVKTRVKDELMKSFSTGECTPLLKTLFTDKIHNHPLHPQHRLFRAYLWGYNNRCKVCSCAIPDDWSRSR